MATRTKLDLLKAALLELGLIAPEESVEADEAAVLGDRYLELLEELRDNGLVYWDADAIPYVVFSAMTRILAGRVATSYGTDEPVVQDDTGRRMSISAQGRLDLRRHMSKRASGVPVEGSFF